MPVRKLTRNHTYTFAFAAFVCFLVIGLPLITEFQHHGFDIPGYDWAATGINAVFYIGTFLLNFYIIIPKFFLRERYTLFTVSVLLLLILIPILCSFTKFHFLIGDDPDHPYNVIAATRFVVPVFVMMITGFLLHAVSEWAKVQEQKKQLTDEKQAAELALLRSQINPHFLFNTLNNICLLARKKSDLTEDAIMRLSQLMRYTMEAAKTDEVSLAKELDFLSSYIGLQRMRLPANVRLEVNIDVAPPAMVIAPMLLISPVENAFKHGVSSQGDSFIDITAKVLRKQLILTVRNSIPLNNGISKDDSSGIGIQNVRNRLALLYPNHHSYTTDNDGKTYTTTLQLDL